MQQLPIDGSVEAIYTDGFILDETANSDISPFSPEHNILRAIINKDAEAEHGPMVSFSVFYKNLKHTIDWTNFPSNARPIRFKHIEADTQGGEITEVRCMNVDFGVQFTDENGINHKEIMEL